MLARKRSIAAMISWVECGVVVVVVVELVVLPFTVRVVLTVLELLFGLVVVVVVVVVLITRGPYIELNALDDAVAVDVVAGRLKVVVGRAVLVVVVLTGRVVVVAVRLYVFAIFKSGMRSEMGVVLINGSRTG